MHSSYVPFPFTLALPILGIDANLGINYRLVRLQQVFGFLTTVGFTLAVLIALTSYTYTLEPTANIKVTDIAVYVPRFLKLYMAWT